MKNDEKPMKDHEKSIFSPKKIEKMIFWGNHQKLILTISWPPKLEKIDFRLQLTIKLARMDKFWLFYC